MQLLNVEKIWTDMRSFTQDFGYQPKINVKKRILQFVTWYKDYYKQSSSKDLTKKLKLFSN